MIDPPNLSPHPSFAILGTGALGGLYGGLLAKAGNEVHFLARSDLQAIRDRGLEIQSPIESFTLESPQVYTDPQDLPPVDVAVVAWKTTSNAALSQVLPQVLKADGVVLVLQNGLDVEQDSANFVGAERVLGGCCFLCSNKVGPGRVHHLDFGAIVFGEYSRQLKGRITARMQHLTEVFRAAKIDMTPAEDLALVRWKKLVWNIPFNGLSVVLEANTSEIMDHPQASKLAKELMLEVREAALANGVEIPAEHVEKMLSATRKMVPYASSMFLDYQAQRPIEVESIFGHPLQAALKAGYRPAKIEMLYEQLCYLDARNRQGSPC